jgi:hypothetical protein
MYGNVPVCDPCNVSSGNPCVDGPDGGGSGIGAGAGAGDGVELGDAGALLPVGAAVVALDPPPQPVNATATAEEVL